MARRRFFVEEVRGGRAILWGADAHHLACVLRAEAGRKFEISDNRRVYLAEITAVEPSQVVFRVLEEIAAALPPVRLALAAALVKFDRFEWIIEKATELGAETIVPVQADRSEKGLDSGARKRLERWRKIAREASQQARRAELPEILAPVSFAEALRIAGRRRYFLDEQPGAPPLPAALPAERLPDDSVALLVGPEGGWTDSEREQAQAATWTAVSLGPLVLRSETAATAALAIIAAAWLR
jgi:16S rRNA (uracil1498-N3)-methyltransferase